MKARQSRKYRLCRGYIHLYTGDGKGKTTAAAGLALRALGAGLRVLMVQFCKGNGSGESAALRRFGKQVCVKSYGTGKFIRQLPDTEGEKAARKGLLEIERLMLSGKFDVVILDEICWALRFNFLDINELLSLMKRRPVTVEIIMTGRGAPRKLFAVADIVTEMKERKHYFNTNVPARKGIEM